MSVRLLAEFEAPERLLTAARQTREASSFRVVDAYSPFAVEGLADEIEGPAPNRVRPAMLVGGLTGGGFGLFLQWYSAVEVLPVLAGGRALASWPDFFFASFEMAILGAASAGFVAMIAGCGLPRLHHALFDVDGFEHASQDRFFLEVEAPSEPDASAARAWLRGLGARSVAEVGR